MKILVIDNYDSFVYNLVHQLRRLGATAIDVVKNDRIAIDAVAGYDKILLSPGPGLPADAGLMPRIIERYAATHSILGICLGHQSIAEAFGGRLYNLPRPLHGIASTTTLTTPDYLFRGIESPLQTGHYHSWVVEEPMPPALEVTAKDAAGNIMALRHEEYDVRGLQFHPESVMTPQGKTIVENWLKGA